MIKNVIKIIGGANVEIELPGILPRGAILHVHGNTYRITSDPIVNVVHFEGIQLQDVYLQGEIVK